MAALGMLSTAIACPACGESLALVLKPDPGQSLDGEFVIRMTATQASSDAVYAHLETHAEVTP